MNIGGGEAADQLVRMMLSGGEVAVRLGGSAVKNLLALSLALAKNHKKLSGKVKLVKMLRETRDLRQFPMTPRQYRQFQKRARKEKLLYSTIRDKDSRGKYVDVVLPVTELDRANQIFERIRYTAQPELEPEREEPRQTRKRQAKQKNHQQAQEGRSEQAASQHPQERPPEQTAPQQPQKGRPEQEAHQQDQKGQPEQEARQQAQKGQPEQEAAARQVKPQKKESRSGQGSRGTNGSSFTAREAATMTPEKPSVEGRLKLYQKQLQAQRRTAPARNKVKLRPKAR